MAASCTDCAVLLDLLELGFSGRHEKVDRCFHTVFTGLLHRCGSMVTNHPAS